MTLTESALSPDDALHSAIIPAGESWIYPIDRGQTLRIVDLEGNQAVDTLFYNAADYADRYDFQNTIRAQGNIYLTTGSRLLSTTNRVLLTIVPIRAGGTTPWAARVPQKAIRFVMPSIKAICTPAARAFWRHYCA